MRNVLPIFMLMLLVGGCGGSSNNTGDADRCGNGTVEGTEVCDDGNIIDGDGCNAVCTSEETCGNDIVDYAAGEACDDGNTIDGDGCQGNCSLPSCGDGVVDTGEACDDGNGIDGDGCNARCTSDETCGNDIVDVAADEQCDDGNTAAGDGCGATCLLEYCGNGAVDTGEECDDGNTTDGDDCSADCMSDETCGNGIVDVEVGEACDDGNTTDGDGCQADCALPSCGDGVEDTGEACDDGNSTDGDGCNARCTSDETCGNDVVDIEVFEQCDDGDVVPGDGCGATCQLEFCGNDIMDPGEECDDGNTLDGDDCSADCFSDETCSNGIVDVEVGEACDDGNTTDGDGCQADCALPMCGDDIDDTGEACDDGNTTDGDGCNSRCTSDESCGNGVVDGHVGEQCDDGDTLTGDGCGATCIVEFCGNDIMDPGEECDDGNIVDGDDCSADCMSDETCGNGVVDGYMGEQCDDGNTDAGDGCGDTCLVEYCGNGILEPGEVCDDGYRDDCGTCNSNCTAVGGGSCGDTELCPETEVCDDGNTSPANGTNDFCAADCMSHTWPCGDWPGYMPGDYSSCRHSFWNTTINGSTTGYTVVTAGSTFPMAISHRYADCGYCPGCVVQQYVGLMPGPAPALEGAFAGCGYGYQFCRTVNNGTTYNSTDTWTAPTEGTYFVRWGATLDYSCVSWGCPPADWNMFAVCVVAP